MNVIDLRRPDRLEEIKSTNLNRIVSQGAEIAQRVLRTIQLQRINDKLVKSEALRFVPHNNPEHGVTMHAGDTRWSLHDHALKQLAGRVEFPREWAQTLRHSGNAHLTTLLAHNLNEMTRYADKRLLVRAVDGQARGIVSDRYKRIDHVVPVDSFAKEAMALDCVPSGGYMTDTRFMLRALHTKAYKITETEEICLGIQVRWSDYASAKYEISPFGFRAMCLNTAQHMPVFSYTHIGGMISANLALSEETVKQDSKLVALATVDAVRGQFEPDSIERIVESLRSAAKQDVEFDTYRRRIVKALGKGLCTKVEEAFKSTDVVNLPSGNTLYRLTNALTWAAQSSDNVALQEDAEQLAGSLLDKAA
jgi:hypothetical protein